MASKKAKPADRKSKPSKPTPKAKGPVIKAATSAKPAKVEKPKKAGKAPKESKVEKSEKIEKIDKVDKPLKAKSAPKAVDVGRSEAPKPSVPRPTMSAPGRRADGWMGPLPDKPQPRRTKLPAEANPLNKREMEQVLTVGMRGAVGEGSLKGRMLLYQGFPYLEVIGRDKRELWFLLQGPDQEVLPAYIEHRVSVSGLIRKFHNYGGSVDVRRYSAKKPELEIPPEVVEPEVDRLRLLSPGEIETIANPGMSVGTKGFARELRGRLEMNGDEFYLVVSNSGTRQQVAFTLEGKAIKGLKKMVGEILSVNGVVEKATGWGGRILAESCSPRAPDFPPVARDSIELTEVVGPAGEQLVGAEVRLNHGLVVRLDEKPGHVWAIEPQVAKRVSLREVDIEPNAQGGAVREFFFTPRNPGQQEIEFFLGKVHHPMQVDQTFKVLLNVKGADAV